MHKPIFVTATKSDTDMLTHTKVIRQHCPGYQPTV